jgi:penicillin G amidase
MWPKVCVVALGVVLAVVSSTQAAPEGWSSLEVGKERVRIYRDAFGVPHVFAASDRGLFTGFGYVVAEDRLWQLELNRRAARGTLAEILGVGSVNADTVARTDGYTESELAAQLAGLSRKEQRRWAAYVDGINRYLTAVVAADPAGTLPYEFHKVGVELGLAGPFMPAPFTATDAAAITISLLRRFADPGGTEVANKAILDALTARHGDAGVADAINDVKWLHDPGAPATIPTLGAIGTPRKAHAHQRQLEPLGAGLPADVERREAATRHWAALGVPDRLGSYAWVVSPTRSRERAAMLHGGPQMGFATPEIVMEVQLTNRRGFDVVGMAIPGIPAVAIGRTPNVAWSLTSPNAGDTTDTFSEARCDAPGEPGYIFEGECRTYERRTEQIAVKAEAIPRSVEVLRSVHGPVVSSTPAVRFAVQRSFWAKEITTVSRFWEFALAKHLGEFRRAARAFANPFNIVYADREGNIAYWFPGCNPLRPVGFDPRLPAPGDGSLEWLGGCRPIEESINPEQGWLGNWNNAPTRDYGNGDQRAIGAIDRGTELLRVLAGYDTFSLDDMRDIPRMITRASQPVGRDSHLVLDYLLNALDAVPPAHPLAPAARALLAGWDGYDFPDAIASTLLSPATVIYRAWLPRMLTNTFADELGPVASQATVNMLLHVLDQTLTGAAGVPPSRDYFNGVDPNRVMSNTFDQILATLATQQGNNPAVWSSPRPVINFTHSMVGSVGTAPRANRSTWAQVVVMSHHEPYGETQLTLGQSGFISRNADGTFTLDPHFRDQLPIFTSYGYKPMPLLRVHHDEHGHGDEHDKLEDE